MAMNQANTAGELTTTATGTYSVAIGDYAVLCNATAGAFTVTLPAASTSRNRVVNIKKIDATVNVVTVDGASTDEVEDASSLTLLREGDNLMMTCDGMQWRVL